MMNQKGRSMIEMLGVLAIIGVLSVGGIAGYSRAMYKYRMNQTIQTVTQALQRLVELSDKDWGFGEFFTSRDIVKYGLLPASMCPDGYVDSDGNTEYSCKLPLGEIWVEIGQLPDKRPNGDFVITFFEGNIVQSCVDFLSHGWEKLYPKEWLIADDEWNGSEIYVAGKDLWAVRPDIYPEAKTNITLNDIQNACDRCRGESECVVGFIFNQEI